MKTFRHLTMIIVSLCFLSPNMLSADTKFEHLERMWKAEEYERLIPELIIYQEEVTHPGVRLLVDYMLGTSMCRVAGYENEGYELLDLIPYIYRHVSEYNYRLILTEKSNCSHSPRTVARLSYEPPGVSGKGGSESISRRDLEHSEKRFTDRIREYNSRLYEIDKGIPLDIENKIKQYIGRNYNTVVYKHFIVAGILTRHELIEAGKILEATLSRFLKQFNMAAPKFYTTVYLIPTSDQMVAFAKAHHEIDIPPTMWGYTFAYDSSVVIKTSGGMGTVGHEIFHALLNYNFPESPPWLNEGYSALFEEFRWEDNRMVGTYRSDHWRIKYLKQYPRRRPSISALVSMDWRQFDAPGSWQVERRHINHTTAKFFAMYLQNRQRKLEEVFHVFRNTDFKRGAGTAASKYLKALEGALDNTPITEIEKDFRDWLASLNIIRTSIIKAKNTAKLDGTGRWDWTVYIDTDPYTLSTIRCVEYTLHPTFPNPVRRECNPTTGFAHSTNGWGTFEIKVKIMFRDGSTKYLTHMLRFY